MSRKRVVVTGLSALTPLGGNVTETWDNLLAGKSGIGPITLFDASGFDSRIAGEVKGFDPEAYGVPAKQARRMDRFVQFAVAAGNMLVEHSGLVINDDNAGRVSVILGVGLGGLHTIEVFHSRLVEAGPGKVSPFMIPMLISNMAPGQLAIATGAKGANMVLTSACASGTHAIGAAYTEIVMGRCDACISGGVEATVTPMGISGFTALKALSTAHNDDPEKASRPFDKDRDGFVMGEGAGLLMLESLEHAQARGATIYAEIIGAGSSDDAFHMTAPRDDGEGGPAARSHRTRQRARHLDPSRRHLRNRRRQAGLRRTRLPDCHLRDQVPDRPPAWGRRRRGGRVLRACPAYRLCPRHDQL